MTPFYAAGRERGQEHSRATATATLTVEILRLVGWQSGQSGMPTGASG